MLTGPSIENILSPVTIKPTFSRLGSNSISSPTSGKSEWRNEILDMNDIESFSFLFNRLYDDSKGNTKACILDTILFKDGVPFRWMCTSEKTGEVTSKKAEKLNSSDDIVKGLKAVAKKLDIENPGAEIATIYFMDYPREVHTILVDEFQLALLLKSKLYEVLAIQLYMEGFTETAKDGGSGIFEHVFQDGSVYETSEINRPLDNIPMSPYLRNLSKTRIEDTTQRHKDVQAMTARIVQNIEYETQSKVATLVLYIKFDTSLTPYILCARSVLLDSLHVRYRQDSIRANLLFPDGHELEPPSQSIRSELLNSMIPNYSGSASLQLPRPGSSGCATSENDDEPEQKGKLKWKEGKYKLGKKQFVANKFIYIPAKLMLSPSFNFGEIFTSVFGLGFVPTIIFRINRAVQTSQWNVKLPLSRKYLHDTYKVSRPISKRDNMRNKEVDYASMLDSKTYSKYIPGTIEHYQGVLEENCRRLLRAQYSALSQAQAVYRVHEIWSDEFETDAVAEWVQESAPFGPYRTPIILGVADKSDFHDDIWAQLRDGSIVDYAQAVKDGREPDDIMLDPRPFFNGDIKIEYDKLTGHPTKSIPHPCLTHLIISDNRMLMEQKLIEAVPWGVILMNGGIKAAEHAVEAIQLGLPLVIYKYTGGVADLVIETHDKVEKWVAAKKAKELNVQDIPPRPFPDDMCPGYQQPMWLYAFDEAHISSCNMLNILVENWPDRHNKDSVFIIDMFTTTEDDVQDRLTQTIAVVGGGEYELGGSSAEERRLSYAMRIRHKFVYNAGIFSILSDTLTIIQLIFAALSTIFAVYYGILGIGYLLPSLKHWALSRTPKNALTPSGAKWLQILGKLNLLLPLAATVVRGIIAAANPYMKYVALKNASVQVEGELYAFRCKVGKYSSVKQSDDDDEDSGDKKKKKKKKKQEGDEEKGGEDAGGPNPRKNFSVALDKIWKELAASDISNGSLMIPQFTSPSAALEDINARIRTNRATQNAYAVPMKFGGDGNAKKKKDDDADNDGDDEDEEKPRGCFSSSVPSLAPTDAYPIDDGISTLTPELYVLVRVNPMSAYYAAKSPNLHTQYCIFATIANILSIAATVFAAAQLVPLVPVVNSVGEFISAFANYKQIELRLLQTNLAMNQLHQQLVWWDSLTIIEKRVPANVDLLVKKSEATIRAQATIFQGGGGGDGDDAGEGGREE